MLKFFALFILIPQLASAASLDAVKYKRAICQIKFQDEVQQKIEKDLMLLMIDEGYGRFGQIEFGDETLALRYQILIEDDIKQDGTTILLQTLLVGDNLATSEISAENPKWVAIKNGDHSLACELVKSP